LALALLGGCTAGGSGGGGGTDGGRLDAAGTDAGRDAAPVTCTTSDDCDDGFECTLDSCVVGNVCNHTALSERCAAGESCSVTRGCIDSCSADADCDDGDFCNGAERCLAERCAPGAARDCDDGNACTVDSCDSALASCTYETAPGCDAGVPPPRDGGTMPMPFDPARDYAGTFLLAPAQNSTCPAGTSYTIAQVTFSTGGGMLTVMADILPLTQTPVPTGPSFDVSFADSCGNYRLQGTFSDSDNFSGTWDATFGGTGCTLCPAMTGRSVIGARI
jgi:hypothetical protein